MTAKQKAYRHGEILLLSVEKLPKEITKSESKIIMTGSHSNDHSIDKGTLYFIEDGITFGYLVAKDTSLLHPEHQEKGKPCPIKDGVYQLVKQQEYTPDGLVPVID